MTSKILNGLNEITGIKSVVYTESVNAGDGLRPGAVCAAKIEVEVYGSQSSAPSVGDALTYYQVDENANETLIGTFYAEPSIPTKNTFRFTAYDAVAKLDAPYSERLNAIQNNFPMTIYALVADACSVAGVTLGSSSWPLSTQNVEAFYADNLTCRNILQYAAEIAGKFVRCDSSGEVIFDWYTTASTGIKPGAATGYVPYKQDGLTYDNYSVLTCDAVAIKPAGTEGAAYIYPTTFGTVTAEDPNGDGNVILTNLVVTDDGNGNLYLSVGAEDDNNDGNVEITSSASASNTLILSGNLLLTNATDATYTAAAQNIYNVMSTLPTYRHATVNLFTFLNPFRAGQFVSVTDAQGVSFTAPVFEMKVEASGATLMSSGKESYETESTSTEKQLANLANNIVQIDKLKVGWADIQEALVQYLKLYGFMEVYEDYTLTTSGGKIGYATGSHTFGSGIALLKEAYDLLEQYFGSTVVAGEDALFIGHANGVVHVDGGVEVNEVNFPLNIRLDNNGITIWAGGLDSNLNAIEESVSFTYGTSGSRSLRPVNTFNGYSDFEHISAPEIGDLSQLTTTAKTSLVAAINEVDKKGDYDSDSTSSSVSVASGTATNLCSVTLPEAGTYMMVGFANFASNSSGYRAVSVTTTSGTIDTTLGRITRVAAADGGNTVVNFTGVPFTINAAQTRYLNVQHNAGSALSVAGTLSYIRLR